MKRRTLSSLDSGLTCPFFIWVKSDSCCSPPRHRAGWTLIELLIAMSMTLVLSLTSALLVIRFLKANSIQTSEVVHSRSMNLWLEQFRVDARHSTSAEISSTPTGSPVVVFFQRGHTASYTMLPDSIIRQYDDAPGGGWSIGKGQWQLTLLMENHLIHGEFTPEAPAPGSSKTSHNARTPRSPHPRKTFVDAALGDARIAVKVGGSP